MYAIGGSGAGEDNVDSASYDLVEKFDGNTWSAVAPLGVGKSKLSVAVCGGKMYAVGG